MNKLASKHFIFLVLLIIFAAFGVSAQTAVQMPDDDPAAVTTKPNLLRELDLTPAQIKQIRQINKERREITQESRQRLNAANKALDEAIYSNASQAEIQSRQKEVQAAHAEFVKNRTINEQAIRQVLTPQQFEKFRQLQNQYNQNKKSNRAVNGNPPKQNTNLTNQKILRQQKQQQRLERQQQRQQQKQQRIQNRQTRQLKKAQQNP